MSTGNFLRCCAFTLTQEGGFCDVQGDPGGYTNHGVTMAELSAALGRQATVDDVRALTDAQAEAIFLPRYWVPVAGDNLPAGVDLMTFDAGVNIGPGTSVRLLQALVGVTADGIIGPDTLAAVVLREPSWLISGLHLAHERYYQVLDGFAEFGVGWLSRNDRAMAAANGMMA